MYDVLVRRLGSPHDVQAATEEASAPAEAAAVVWELEHIFIWENHLKRPLENDGLMRFYGITIWKT